MPARRRTRDPYRTPSPPPRRDGRLQSEIHGNPQAELSVGARPSNPSTPTENNPTGLLQHGKHNSPNMDSHFRSGGQIALSTNSSPGSVPSLSMTPSSMTSSIPKPPGIFEPFYPTLVDDISEASIVEEYSGIDLGVFDGSLLAIKPKIIDKCPPPIEDTPARPSIARNLSEFATHWASAVIPTNQAYKPIAHLTTPEHLRRPSYSMSVIATTLVVLQRCIRNRLNDQHTKFEFLASQTRSQKISTEIMSNLRSSEKPDINSWLFQSLPSEKLSSRSETDSIGSLESDDTIDSFRDEMHLRRGEESSGDVACWATEADPRDFLLSSKQILSHLPSGIAASLFVSLSSLFDSWVAPLLKSQQASDNSPSSGSFSYSQREGTTENTKSASNGKKRGFHDEDDEFANSGDNDGRGKRRLNGESSVGPRQKWACPYYQREPHRYCVETECGDFRKCARSPGFKEVHRVKDHIYKCHAPKYCNRCYNLFKEEEELEIHLRKDPACGLKQPPVMEGLTTKQKALLKPRDRSNKSDEERWNTIYKICFPEDEIIPSPYYVHYSREIAELRREVLEIVRVETESPAVIDANRLMQRLHEAFNAQLSPESPSSLIPRTPAVLTPSTTNGSTRSTDLSSQGQKRVPYQESPSVTRISQEVASALGVTSTMLSIDDLAKQCTSFESNNGPPAWPFNSTPLSGSNNDPSLPEAVLPVPFRLSNDTPFDFDLFMFDFEGNTASQLDSANSESLDNTGTE